MKAIIYENFQGSLAVRNVDDPIPDQDGVVIELKSSGLCLSDWHGWMGHDQDIKLPHIPGHELAGFVVEVGVNIKKFNIGGNSLVFKRRISGAADWKTGFPIE